MRVPMRAREEKGGCKILARPEERRARTKHAAVGSVKGNSAGIGGGGEGATERQADRKCEIAHSRCADGD